MSLSYAENVTRSDDGKLQLLGWGAPRRGSANDIPGQARTLEVVREGADWVHVDWKEPSEGGQVGAYKIQRRKRDGGGWIDVGDKCALTIQVVNDLEPGGGGSLRGDAHFKDIKVAVKGIPGISRLVDQEGMPIDGNRWVYRSPIESLAEGQDFHTSVLLEVVGMTETSPLAPSQEPVFFEYLATIEGGGGFRHRALLPHGDLPTGGCTSQEAQGTLAGCPS